MDIRMEDIRVVVAIDFGTTNSAFAFAHKEKPEETETNTIWPGSKGIFKTPTALQYDSKYEKVTAWGVKALVEFQEDADDDNETGQRSRPVELFKLHLFNSKDEDKPWLPPQLNYKQAVKDYLTEMRKLIEERLSTRWSNVKFPDQVRIVMTIPAEWPPHATGIMRECAYNAGLLNKNMCIDDNKSKQFTSYLKDFHYYRLDGYDDHKRRLIAFVWGELEARGLKHRSEFNQHMKELPIKQKEKLRAMVLERMKALVDISQPNNKSPVISGKNGSDSLKDRLDILQSEKDALLEQVIELQKENSKYQATLGNLTNLGFNDEDSNNIVKLDKDVKHLQDLLEDFTLVSGPEYEIDVA
ncbi:12476_t:CDS:2, partial [Racocetra fulgida]